MEAENKKARGKNNSLVNNKKLLVGIIAAVVVICVAGFFIYNTYFKAEYLNDQQIEELKENGAFADGVSVNGIDISGKTYEEGKTELEAAEAKKIAEIKYTLKNAHGTVDITGEDFVATFNTEDVLVEALKYGLEGNSFDKNAAKAELEQGKNFELTMNIDKEATLANIATKLDPLSKKAVEPSADIASNGSDLVYKEGSAGYEVDAEALNLLITEQIDAGNLIATIQAPTNEVQPKQTIEELKKYTSLISQYKTTYKGTSGRKYNVEKAAGLVNGTKLEPGESASINDILGPRISGRGWQYATAILNGEHVQELGGGVCQVSSTLYNALLMADVTILQRSPHSEPSTYVPIGRDATISTGGPDLVFRNDDDHPIFIFSVINKSKSTITFKVYGEPLDDGVTISLTSKTVATLQPTSPEVIVKDNTQLTTYEKVVIKRKAGYKSKTYKQFIKNGSVIKTELVTTDVYPAKAGKRIVGTKEIATPTPTTTTTPSTTPTTTPTTSPSVSPTAE